MQKLIICVCTRGRSNMLLESLGSISRLVIPEEFEVETQVCDNNSSPMDVADRAILTGASTLPIFYTHQPVPGIPVARNAALIAALTHNPDWIAFIDDDEKIDDQWLLAMQAAMQRWPADIYHGWTQSFPEDPEAPWSFHQVRNKREAGTTMSSAGTDNVLFKRSLVAEDGDALRFDEQMQFSGGSDLEFFYQATDLGRKIIWVPDAITREKISLSRLTFEYQVKRAYSVASAQAYISVKRMGKKKALRKILPKSTGRLIGGATGMAFSALTIPFNRRSGRKRLLNSTKKLASAFGMLKGTKQQLGAIYERIDGN